MLTHKKPRPGSLDDAEAAKRGRYRRSRVSGGVTDPCCRLRHADGVWQSNQMLPCVSQVQTVVGHLLRARPYSLLLLAASLCASWSPSRAKEQFMVLQTRKLMLASRMHLLLVDNFDER